MQHTAFEVLERFLSPERLATYLRMAAGNPQKAADLYLENLRHCQSFYTFLHWLEVGLRNAMNRQLSQKYGAEWYDNPKMGLGHIECQQIQKAKDTLTKNRKPHTNPDIIAALNFGIWVRPYWHRRQS